MHLVPCLVRFRGGQKSDAGRALSMYPLEHEVIGRCKYLRNEVIVLCPTLSFVGRQNGLWKIVALVHSPVDCATF